MISKKVCMLGSYAVGKTSLVRRFVDSMFSEKYQTTVGVKVDKKVVQALDREVCLVLWDIHGVEESQPLRRSYLRGAHGYFMVCDGTRLETLEECVDIASRAEVVVGDAPSLLLVNKKDLEAEWEISPSHLDTLRGRGWSVLPTSAKSGENVGEAFQLLTVSMLTSRPGAAR